MSDVYILDPDTGDDIPLNWLWFRMFFLYLHYAVMAHVEIIVIIASPDLVSGLFRTIWPMNLHTWLPIGTNVLVKIVRLEQSRCALLPPTVAVLGSLSNPKRPLLISFNKMPVGEYLNDLRYEPSPICVRVHDWHARARINIVSVYQHVAFFLKIPLGYFANVKYFTDVCNAVLWRIAARFILSTLLFRCWISRIHIMLNYCK